MAHFKPKDLRRLENFTDLKIHLNSCDECFKKYEKYIRSKASRSATLICKGLQEAMLDSQKDFIYHYNKNIQEDDYLDFFINSF